jgi:uncharacterized protein YdaU (DUF1376 family)
MGKSPAFQLYAADFYMDTAGWTATEVGAYFRLLMHEWVNGALPVANASLARIAGIDPRNMHKMWSAVIAKKFTTDTAGMYVNLRLESTREEQNKYREIQAEKGKKSAEIRWKDHITAVTPRLQPEVLPKRNPSSSSSSSNNKKIYIIPTIEEIRIFCNERKNKIDPQYFLDYQTAREWKLKGGQKIRDWKAVIRTWEKNNFNTGGNNGNTAGNQRPVTQYRGSFTNNRELDPAVAAEADAINAEYYAKLAAANGKDGKTP